MVATREDSPCADTTVHNRHGWGWPQKVCNGITVEEYKASQAARDDEDEALTAIVTEMARLQHDEELAQRVADGEAYGLPIEEQLTWDVISPLARQHKVEAMRRVLRYALDNVGRESRGRWKTIREPEGMAG